MSKSLALIESPLEAFARACKISAPMTLRATHRLNGTPQDHSLAHPFAFLGRAQSMGVRLDDPSISQCHCYLQVIGGLPYLTDLGSRTGVVWVDGRQARGWVYPGETVRVGAFDLQFTSTNADMASSLDTDSDLSTEATEPRIELEILGNGTRIDTHVVDEPLVLVGRHPACQLRFLVDDVAYFQCALINTSEGLWCLDYLSPKGTKINGRQSRLRQLRDGDLMEFGKTCLVVHVGRTAPPTPVQGPARNEFAAAASASPEALAPFREVADQFQSCFMSMVQMFTAMQQEHASMVCEQLRLMQELLKEVREMRMPAPIASPPVINSVSPDPLPTKLSAPVPQPTRKRTDAVDEKVLQQAHEWLMDRLKQVGQTPTAKPN